MSEPRGHVTGGGTIGSTEKGRGRTSQVHAGLQTLPYATRGAVFPADLVDDAVIPAGAKVVVLT